MTELQAGREPENTADPRRALNADFSTHQLRHSRGDGQPKAGASMLACDPSGWTVGNSCVQQFCRFGLPLSQPLQYVVRAECFSPEELELFALPCPAKTPSQKTAAANWVKASGGIGGRAFGIHANHLQPYERVRERVAELLSC